MAYSVTATSHGGRLLWPSLFLPLLPFGLRQGYDCAVAHFIRVDIRRKGTCHERMDLVVFKAIRRVDTNPGARRRQQRGQERCYTDRLIPTTIAGDRAVTRLGERRARRYAMRPLRHTALAIPNRRTAQTYRLSFRSLHGNGQHDRQWSNCSKQSLPPAARHLPKF